MENKQMNDRFSSRAKEWNFNPRIIAMFKAFIEQYMNIVPLDKTMDVLDVGGGTGLIAFEIAPLVSSITIIDTSPAMLGVAHERLLSEKITNSTLIEGDIVTTPIGNKKFDRIHAHMSLHHIKDIGAALEKMSNLLKPGGLLVIADLLKEDGSFHGEDIVPHNGFDIDELATALSNAKLTVQKVLPLASVEKGDVTLRVYERFFMVACKEV